MISPVYMICDAYESGFGHGLKRDGHDDAKRDTFAHPAHGEAYRIGYKAGAERAMTEPIVGQSLRERAEELRRELARVERKIAGEEAVAWNEHRRQRQAVLEAMDAAVCRSLVGPRLANKTDPEFWDHFCPVERDHMGTAKGEPCSWCDQTEVPE